MKTSLPKIHGPPNFCVLHSINIGPWWVTGTSGYHAVHLCWAPLVADTPGHKWIQLWEARDAEVNEVYHSDLRDGNFRESFVGFG